MRFALALLTLFAQPAWGQVNDTQRRVDAANFGDWRTVVFSCLTDDRPPAFVPSVCNMIKRQVDDAAARARVPVLHAPNAASLGSMGGSGYPMLVAYVSTTQRTLEQGVAVHVSLRAEQSFWGEVRTRRSAAQGDVQASWRDAILVLWERRMTGFLIGADGLEHLSAPMNNMVQEFFVTLLGARR